MKFNTFLFHVGSEYFPGHNVIHPFYLSIEYAYYEKGGFISVLNVEMSFKAIGSLTLNSKLAIEIEAAARNHWRDFINDNSKHLCATLPEPVSALPNESKKDIPVSVTEDFEGKYGAGC